MKDLENKFLDIGGAIAAAITAIMALADNRVRPYIVEFFRTIRTGGVRSWQFIRECFDRHLVSVVLRPWLTVSLAITAALLVVPQYVRYRLGVSLPEEATWWLAGIGAITFVLMLWQRWRVRNVRSVNVNDPRWIALAPADRDQAHADDVFGRAGLAPSSVIAILFGQLVAGLELLAVAAILRSFPAPAADPLVSTTFVLAGIAGLVLVGIQWIVLARLAGWTVILGAGIATRVARAILRPVVQALPTIDEKNIDEFVPEGLGFPHKKVGEAISKAHTFPFAVMAGFLALIVSEHSIRYLLWLTALAAVLVLGYYFMEKITEAKTRRYMNAVVVGFFLLAVYQLLRRLMGSSAWEDYLWTQRLLDLTTGATALVLIGFAAVGIVVAVVGKSLGNGIGKFLLYGGIALALFTAGSCGVKLVQLNQAQAMPAPTASQPQQDPKLNLAASPSPYRAAIGSSSPTRNPYTR